MKQKKWRYLLYLLVFGCLVVGLTAPISNASSYSSSSKEFSTSQNHAFMESEAPKKPNKKNTSRQRVQEPEPENRWASYRNVCESFTVIEGAKAVRDKHGRVRYPLRYRRNRYERSKEDQQRTRDLIRLVAREMGANREGQLLLEAIALHESSWNPEAIHILNNDLEANHDAWRRHTYSAFRERGLQEQLESTDARSKKYWELKAKLGDIRTYKGNPYWKHQLEYLREVPSRVVRGKTYDARTWKDLRSVWGFGYGLYGMNAVLYVSLIAQDAPPWILCSDEGIVATIAAIWALRDQQDTCKYLSQKDPEKYGVDGGSVRSVIRRWGTGRCGKGRLSASWKKLFPRASLTESSVVDFGGKFPRFEMVKKGSRRVYKKDPQGNRVPTDPQAVIAHMRLKAEEAQLLRPEPLKRKKPGTAPVVIANR